MHPLSIALTHSLPTPHTYPHHPLPTPTLTTHSPHLLSPTYPHHPLLTPTLTTHHPHLPSLPTPHTYPHHAPTQEKLRGDRPERVNDMGLNGGGRFTFGEWIYWKFPKILHFGIISHAQTLGGLDGITTFCIIK